MTTMTSPRRTSMETSREDRAGPGKIVARTGDAICGLVIVAMLPPLKAHADTQPSARNFLQNWAVFVSDGHLALAVISQTEARRRHERKKLTRAGGCTCQNATGTGYRAAG